VVVTAEQFALTPVALQGEWWRLWTGHLVHYDALHLTTNVIASGVPLTLLDRKARWHLLVAMLLIAPALSVFLLMHAGFDEYRGASGLALAVWAAAAITLLRSGSSSSRAPFASNDFASARLATERDRATGWALIFLAATKLVAETAGSGHVWIAVPALPFAHLAGALLGVLAAIVLAADSTDRNAISSGQTGAPSNRAPQSKNEPYCAGTYVGSAVVLSITEP
jgi:membrane associated rhomboid family serine protease